ncbi:MAG TPA: GNAT family N-acetyltransferase [Burkholderiaceae bacterium]|nr:GNAT family N-acetyltransferase [Burkholderiaceae bacterium]HQR70661.1 GNAT family N-acetyltransferase [Burkholderiaceae bacterium]
MARLTFAPLTPSRLDDYLRYFDTRAFSDNPRWSGCYCYFPLHDPDTTDWSRREPAENRNAVSACVRAGTARGVLAYADADVVGWCSAGPWSQFPMLADASQPQSGRTGVIFCFVVAPEWRGQGVAAGLLAAACGELKSQGLQVAHARPLRNASGPAANHLGPLPLYLKAGFRIVREDGEKVFVEKTLT